MQLELNQFDWINWVKFSDKKEKKEEFKFLTRLNDFENYFFSENKNEYLTSTRKTTWRSSYKPYLKRLISIQNDTNNENLDNIFITTLKTYKEGSRSRKQCATSLSVLAKFLEHKLPEDWKLMSKGYGLNLSLIHI